MSLSLFPSPLERTVASALLLLSNTKPLSPSPEFGFDGGTDKALREGSESKSSSEEISSSKSHSSSLTSDNDSSKEIRAAHNLRIVAVVARCHEMKFKVVRKRRTKVIWSSDSEHPEVVLALPATVSSKSESTEASCLSSTSSAASSARSCYEIRSMKRNQMESCENPKRRKVDSGYGSGSSYMRRQAEKILDFLSRGSSSEVRIRQVLGDSPDTSKALRMLLKLEEIKRSGTGGRLDPYLYKFQLLTEE
ncbi:uncharacterized protein LOC110623756 isoform X1 [Manihot esculenta]|uniref:HTH three-helical bundle domain-containing protein n=6 Tax=Manihot esculenta TaxID=3983 RepID=A0A2C9V8G4_MANES|nr:uncharacterized protein LOC110623756 isoform X1 [Manihot esculenta]OAY40433.1 hypothetical protein MANES_09G021650v8 [Manihot esculenta]